MILRTQGRDELKSKTTIWLREILHFYQRYHVFAKNG